MVLPSATILSLALLSQIPPVAPPDTAAKERDPSKPGVSITVYSSADVRGFDPQQFVAQQRMGVDPMFASSVPGFGMVRETRTVKLKRGLNDLSFTDVAAFIDPTTVGFVDLTHPGTSVLEQNFEFDLVSPAKLYERFVGSPVRLVAQDKPDVVVTGTLLSSNQSQFVIDSEQGIAVVPAVGTRVELLGDLPGGLQTKPTLVWKVNADVEGEHTIRTTYQTAGMTWRADYNLVLGADDSTASMTPWVTLLNVSGVAFRDAQLKLIAGDVNRVQQPRVTGGRALRAPAALAEAADAGFEEEQLFEYHLYTLPRPATVNANASQQLALFPPVSDLKIEKQLVYVGAPNFWGFSGGRLDDAELHGGMNKKVGVFVSMTNNEASGLGRPLPKGRVRVYKSASDGTLEFVGEDVIDHTPKNETIRLKLGDAFDVTGERIQTDFKANNRAKEMVESFRITLKNAKNVAQKVEVREYLYRWSTAEITAKSQDFRKLDARSIAFDVEVPAEGSKSIEYTVRYTW